MFNKKLCGAKMETVKNSNINYNCADLAQVSRIIDGDTIEGVCTFRGKIKMRLNSIDSWESRKIKRAYKQARNCCCTVEEIVTRGKVAKEVTKELILNKQVAVFTRERKYGMYGRLLVDIYFIKDNTWVNLNKYLLVNYSDLFFEYGK